MSISDWIECHGGKVVLHFKILREGWEMDNSGWIIRGNDGKCYCVFTSHGILYRASMGEFYEEFAIHAKAYEGFLEAKELLEA